MGWINTPGTYLKFIPTGLKIPEIGTLAGIGRLDGFPGAIRSQRIPT